MRHAFPSGRIRPFPLSYSERTSLGERAAINETGKSLKSTHSLLTLTRSVSLLYKPPCEARGNETYGQASASLGVERYCPADRVTPCPRICCARDRAGTRGSDRDRAAKRDGW